MPASSDTTVAKRRNRPYGELNAMQDRIEIFESKSVYYNPHGKIMIIIGNGDQYQQVALCAPKDLAPGKLHTVVYPEDLIDLPDGYLTWIIEVKGNFHIVEKGTMTITYGPNNESAEGSYHVTVKGTREEIGGNFKISNPS